MVGFSSTDRSVQTEAMTAYFASLALTLKLHVLDIIAQSPLLLPAMPSGTVPSILPWDLPHAPSASQPSLLHADSGYTLNSWLVSLPPSLDPLLNPA